MVKSDMDHQCDSWLDPTDTPLTRSRIRRLLAAAVDGTEQDVAAVLQELGECPMCLTAGLIGMTKMAADFMPHRDAHSIMAADLLMGAVLDESQAECDNPKTAPPPELT